MNIKLGFKLGAVICACCYSSFNFADICTKNTTYIGDCLKNKNLGDYKEEHMNELYTMNAYNIYTNTVSIISGATDEHLYGRLRSGEGIKYDVYELAMDLVLNSLDSTCDKERKYQGIKVNFGARILHGIAKALGDSEKLEKIKKIINRPAILNSFCLLGILGHKNEMLDLYKANKNAEIGDMPYAEDNITYQQFYNKFDKLYEAKIGGYGISIKEIIEQCSGIDDKTTEELKSDIRNDVCWYIKNYRLLTLFAGANSIYKSIVGEEVVDSSSEENAKGDTETEILVSENQIHHAPGFTNMGNTCYFNSTLQCMYASKQIRGYLRDYNGEDESILSLKQFFEELDQNNGDTISQERMEELFDKTARVYNTSDEFIDAKGKPKKGDSSELFGYFANRSFDEKTKNFMCFKNEPEYGDSSISKEWGEPKEIQQKNIQALFEKIKEKIIVIINEGVDLNEMEKGFTPPEEITNKNGTYRMVAVTIYTGVHYYAYVRDENGGWHCQNDGSSTKTSFDVVQTDIAGNLGVGVFRYVIYELVEDDPKSELEQLDKIADSNSNEKTSLEEENKEANTTNAETKFPLEERIKVLCAYDNQNEIENENKESYFKFNAAIQCLFALKSFRNVEVEDNKDDILNNIKVFFQWSKARIESGNYYKDPSNQFNCINENKRSAFCSMYKNDKDLPTKSVFSILLSIHKDYCSNCRVTSSFKCADNNGLSHYFGCTDYFEENAGIFSKKANEGFDLIASKNGDKTPTAMFFGNSVETNIPENFTIGNKAKQTYYLKAVIMKDNKKCYLKIQNNWYLIEDDIAHKNKKCLRKKFDDIHSDINQNSEVLVYEKENSSEEQYSAFFVPRLLRK